MPDSAANPRPLLTVEQFERLSEETVYRRELVRGRVVREPAPGELHGSVTISLGRYLIDFVEKHNLGRVSTDVGVIFERNPDTLRRPDLIFVSKERMSQYPTVGFLAATPDLCVEILSPSNRASAIQRKVMQYLTGGARLVWVIDPLERTVTVYPSLSNIRILDSNDVLEGDDVLPGFYLPLARLFAT